MVVFGFLFMAFYSKDEGFTGYLPEYNPAAVFPASLKTEDISRPPSRLSESTILTTVMSILLLLFFNALVWAAGEKLSYVKEPPHVYVAPKPANITTLLDFIDSREDLSNLSQILREPAGFVKAFDTAPAWSFTFFAPSNEAFEHTGAYYSTFAATPYVLPMFSIWHSLWPYNY
jgi:hypothetical protein